ncbi:unnamed protein product [Microthlaspi erraticum]|uniref:Zinc finger GRF-type domain-containing protein n=1 Tax=Microthlaspi erraticum TaxID=1685480 RepID=A0A6D2IZ01_9BRAS|nr:unnamed protein product [Microthlaspi erraticum]
MFVGLMDPNDPNVYEWKKAKNHIQMLGYWADGNCGIMTWCPCGEDLIQEVVDGTRYYTCEQYKYDSVLHVRKRWDTAIEEEVLRLKDENEAHTKKICELGAELHLAKRKAEREAIGEEVEKLKEENAEQAKKLHELGVQHEKTINDVRELWDSILNLSCGCSNCKDEVKKTVGVFGL